MLFTYLYLSKPLCSQAQLHNVYFIIFTKDVINEFVAVVVILVYVPKGERDSNEKP